MRAWIAGSVAPVVLAGGASLGALPASAKGRRVPTQATQERLPRMFADRGRCFNASEAAPGIDGVRTDDLVVQCRPERSHIPEELLEEP